MWKYILRGWSAFYGKSLLFDFNIILLNGIDERYLLNWFILEIPKYNRKKLKSKFYYLLENINASTNNWKDT